MKTIKKTLLALTLLLLSFSAFASQNTTVLPTVGPYPGLTMLFNLNAAMNSLQTNFSGAACSGVTSPQTYQFCFDTSANALRMYNGSVWLPLGNLAGSQWAAISNGVPFTIPSSTGSSNAYVVTYASVPTAYVTGQHYPFIANFANTTTATENVNGLGAKTIKKQGGTNLGSADIGSGAVVDTVYDGTNLQMLSQTGNSASGSVTSVGCGTGLAGGTITSSGTCSVAPIGTSQIFANTNTGASAVPVGTSLSGFFDLILGSAQGDIIFRGSSTWGVLTPGTNGQVLTTGGAGGNVSWASNSNATNVQTFTSSGTWTKPGGTTISHIECIGGGGGGGAGSGGGGATNGSSAGGGSYKDRWVATASMGSTETVTIGGGGTAGVSAQDGGNGGSSSVGAWVTAYGGTGGGGAIGPSGTNSIGGPAGGWASTNAVAAGASAYKNDTPGEGWASTGAGPTAASLGYNTGGGGTCGTGQSCTGNGGASVKGGGGGACGGSSGTSQFSGSGGSTNGGGGVPGGGGGCGAANNNGGAGARGQCVVESW